eukprot:819923_1
MSHIQKRCLLQSYPNGKCLKMTVLPGRFPLFHHLQNRTNRYQFLTNQNQPRNAQVILLKTVKLAPFSTHSPRYTPYHPPVSINLSLAPATTITSEGQSSPQSLLSSASDISSCLSPRDQTPKSRVSAIPDFCDYSEEFEDVVTIRIPRTKKKKSNRKVEKDARKSKKKKKKRSMTPTPNKKNRVEWKGKTNSNVLTRNEMEQYNEYAVEMEDGFIFFQPYSNMRKKVNV